MMTKLNFQAGCQGELRKRLDSYLAGREKRTPIRGASSSWTRMTGGVPQGSVLVQLPFLIYVNDLPNETESYLNVSVDDVKFMQ